MGWFGSASRKYGPVLDEDISTRFDGELLDGLAHGQGRAIGRNSYEGHFQSGRKHGRGAYRWRDGATYDGEWQDDKRHGQGVQTNPDGTVYDGGWQSDRKHGAGIVTDWDGVSQTVEFIDGRLVS